MKHRLLEIGKDLLIVLLVLVNLVLAIMCLPRKTLTETKWLAGALRPFAGLFGLNEAELTYTLPSSGNTITGAAQPVLISLNTEAGRQSAQYSFDALDELYSQYGSLLAQALESGAALQSSTRAAFNRALLGQSAVFCYPGAVSPEVVGAWLNVRAPSGAAAQWYLLAAEPDGIALYLLGEDCQVLHTGLSSDALTQQLQTVIPDGSSFAIEADGAPYAALDPLSLVSASSAAVHDAARALFPRSPPRSASTPTATRALWTTTARPLSPRPASACA